MSDFDLLLCLYNFTWIFISYFIYLFKIVIYIICRYYYDNTSVNFCATSIKMIKFKGSFNVCESNIEQFSLFCFPSHCIKLLHWRLEAVDGNIDMLSIYISSSLRDRNVLSRKVLKVNNVYVSQWKKAKYMLQKDWCFDVLEVVVWSQK